MYKIFERAGYVVDIKILESMDLVNGMCLDRVTKFCDLGDILG